MSKVVAIVTAKRNKPTTTSLIVAESCGIQHKNTIALIRKYQSDFETFGLVAFETRARLQGQHGGGDAEFVNLNESQATYLITTLEKNCWLNSLISTEPKNHACNWYPNHTPAQGRAKLE